VLINYKPENHRIYQDLITFAPIFHKPVKLMMHFKSTLLSLLFITLIINAEAKLVNVNEAELVAKNFIYVTLNKYDNGIQLESIRLSDPYIYQTSEGPAFYAFGMNPGFIIVSAEDGYTPVLGYSFENSFVFDEAPDHYKQFILNYVDQIRYIREQSIMPPAEIESLWNDLRMEDVADLSISRERDVTPLLSCLWNQGSPYNLYCPEDAAGPGGRVWVGCVATAMAQIMYYWRYPETGTGSHCYTPGNSSYGQQCANFGQTAYNWEGMINGVDNRFPEANAELQYQCAVAVNMDFGPNGSGSQSYLVPGSIDQYFRYNDAVYEERQDFSYSNWVNLLKDDIDAGKPLYYSGYTDDWSGHAFVCDGYQGENFHFNFGWSGSSNGYYSLYDVGGFSNWQACVRNFAPSDNAYPYYSSGSKTLTGRSGSITDGSGPTHNYISSNTAYWLIDPQTLSDSITSITLTFSAFDVMTGDSVKVYDGATTSSPLLGAYTGSTMPPAVSTTQNRMLVEFKSNSGNEASGWYAEYSSASPAWCQGLKQLTEPTGTFNDGSGNFYYQGQATCMWRINPPGANKITLSFNYFDTEEGYDFFKVYDGTTQIGEFSGNDIPQDIVANSGIMFITWTTNSSNNFQGWEAYYEVDNVGVEDIQAVNDLHVYPNPATDILHISFSSKENTMLNIRLLNITGQPVYSSDLSSFSGGYDQDLDLKAFPTGVYFLEIITFKGTVNKKVVIR